MKQKFCLNTVKRIIFIAMGIYLLIGCNQSKTPSTIDQQLVILKHEIVDNPDSHLWQPIPDILAKSNLDLYRDSAEFAQLAQDVKRKTFGVVHEPESALAYDIDFFPNFVKAHQQVKNHYKWSVGLYPQIVSEIMTDGKPHSRLSILMIPTMRNTDTVNFRKDIIDYFSAMISADSIYYIPDSIRSAGPEKIKEFTAGSGGGGYSYDQGTVFP